MINFLKKHQSLLLLFLILAIAVFFRFYLLETIPPGLHHDEGENAKDALWSLENNKFLVFYTNNFGREGLFYWLSAASFKIFGVSPWSLRLVSAIIGTLTVLGLYLMTKEIFKTVFKKAKAERVALFASFLLAVSFWHVIFSRIGYRAVLVPLILCFSFYFLFKGINGKKFFNFIIAGILFGLGFYTYIAFRVTVLLLAVLIVLEIIRHWRNRRPSWSFGKLLIASDWKKWLVFFAAVFFVALPIGLYFLTNPQEFVSRSSHISVFGQKNPALALLVSTAKSLGMFNVYGDPNWRHNYSGQPALSFPVGILFLIGLTLTIKKALNIFRRRTKDAAFNFSCVSLFLLAWFAVMLLPAVLTYEGLPHALRSIGVIPPVFVFASLGFFWLYGKIAEKNKKIAVAVLIFFLIFPVFFNYCKYFHNWAQNKNLYWAFDVGYERIYMK